MIRLANSVYEQKKSALLLKYKDFTDAEFEIVDVVEGVGNRAGMCGRFIVRDVNGILAPKSDGSGREFKSSPMGNFDLFREYWTNKENYIGTQVTVKYQETTPIDKKDSDKGGVPRFSNVHSVRDYE
tara:strand:- start:459 stop:839 length:381 start_codon:yes stop_codon:yes gene_type:complete